MRTLKIVVADDHRLMLEGLRLALGRARGIRIVGETDEGRKVLPLVAETKPDVVLLDVMLPDMDGLVVLDRLRQQLPDVKVILRAGHDDKRVIQEAMRLGASAFVLKGIDPSDLPGAIRQAVAGTVYKPIGRDETPDETPTHGLTPKEREVLEQVARGLSNADIGRELWLSQQTVKFHLTNVYRKLGVANRTEAARFAYRHSLVGSFHEREQEG